jgi:hypothetical protein
MMRTFELRVSTLRTKEPLDFYRDAIYPCHLKSFPLFGIEAHGFWTAIAGSYRSSSGATGAHRDDLRDFSFRSVLRPPYSDCGNCGLTRTALNDQ